MRWVVAVLLAMTMPLAAEPDPEFGAQLFQDICAACHGAEAKGGGPMSKLLTVEPPDLTKLAAENGGEFPTFRVVRQIDGRDPLLAHGGEMPLFGQLFDFPDAAIQSSSGQPIITAQPIADLTSWLQSVQR